MKKRIWKTVISYKSNYKRNKKNKHMYFFHTVLNIDRVIFRTFDKSVECSTHLINNVNTRR